MGRTILFGDSDTRWHQHTSQVQMGDVPTSQRANHGLRNRVVTFEWHQTLTWVDLSLLSTPSITTFPRHLEELWVWTERKRVRGWRLCMRVHWCEARVLHSWYCVYCSKPGSSSLCSLHGLRQCWCVLYSTHPTVYNVHTVLITHQQSTSWIKLKQRWLWHRLKHSIM